MYYLAAATGAFLCHKHRFMKKYAFILSVLCTMPLLPGCHLFSKHGERLDYGAGELFYGEGVTKTEAEKLGGYLLRAGMFDESTPRSVQIGKRNDTFVFRMVTKEAYIADTAFECPLRFMAMDLSADVFGGAGVDVELTDDAFHTKKTIPAYGVRTITDSASVYRSFAVDAATAARVTEFLVQAGFIDKHEMIICYDIEGDDFLFGMMTVDGAEKDPAAVQQHKLLAGMVSAGALDNKPVRLQFLAGDYTVKAVYPFEEILAARLHTGNVYNAAAE